MKDKDSQLIWEGYKTNLLTEGPKIEGAKAFLKTLFGIGKSPQARNALGQFTKAAPGILAKATAAQKAAIKAAVKAAGGNIQKAAAGLDPSGRRLMAAMIVTSTLYTAKTVVDVAKDAAGKLGDVTDKALETWDDFTAWLSGQWDKHSGWAIPTTLGIGAAYAAFKGYDYYKDKEAKRETDRELLRRGVNPNQQVQIPQESVMHDEDGKLILEGWKDYLKYTSPFTMLADKIIPWISGGAKAAGKEFEEAKRGLDITIAKVKEIIEAPAKTADAGKELAEAIFDGLQKTAITVGVVYAGYKGVEYLFGYLNDQREKAAADEEIRQINPEVDPDTPVI